MPTLSVTASTDDNTILHTGNSWATITSASTGTTVGTVSATTMVMRADRDAGTTYTLTRGYYYFDTSSLPDDCVITAGTLTFNQTAGVNGAGSSAIDPMNVVKGTFPTGALATSDFGSLDKTQVFGTLTFGTGAGSGKTITLDASMLQTYVSRAGNTKFCLVPNNDVNSASLPNVSSATTSRTQSSSDDGTPGNRPTLALTYLLVDSAHNFI